MMYLKEGSFLLGGRYRVDKVLGQGGFGITYLGIQIGLNRKVAIKEFFMKEYCNRNEETSCVSVPSMGSKDLVERFRQKFIKEAQIISQLNHPNIIYIHDVFEENGTAYYVMEYHSHGSLSDLVEQRGKLDEADAIGYIRQIGDALRYIHDRKITHLDVKPGNVLLDSDGRAVLIDFGMSKRYDVDGGQTSTTPVGISHGYAPLEQYKKGGVGTFSPATDIYSLGAILYKLLTGITPPDASEVEESVLSSSLSAVSVQTKEAVLQSMQLRRKDRPQCVDAFLSLLDISSTSLASVDDEVEITVIDVSEVSSPVPPSIPEPPISEGLPVSGPKPSSRKWLIPLVLVFVVVLGIFGLTQIQGGDDESFPTDSLTRVDTIPVVPPVVDKPVSSKVSTVKEKGAVPSTCPLSVSTSPVGATVYLDGKKLGKSPLENKKISRGKHTVKLVLDGYESFSKQYTFGDKPIVINETLVSVRSSVQEQSSNSASSVVSAAFGTINGHAYVDLGLSVKWATMNVGAGSPSDFGDFFAWGEVLAKSEYTEENNKTKEKVMGVISGNSQYDAACYHWGSSWRLPTESEFRELKDKCRWTWTALDGHVGYKIVAPNGKSIFLPAAGYRSGSAANTVGISGEYWTGSPFKDKANGAYYLRFFDDRRDVDWGTRYFGQNVRPVSD